MAEEIEYTAGGEIEAMAAAPSSEPQDNRDVENAFSKRTSPADPFALREGKSLSWHNINMTVADKKGGEGKSILKEVWGEVPAQETTAIMGPSGAGKTSLLNVLSGRVTTRGKVTITADVRVNDARVDPADISIRKQIAFVAQDDSLMISSTPRECIRFSAKLRLDKNTTEEELDELTNIMLRELGLEGCADTLVGGEMLKGISGGERKRTSVGVELVTKPNMVFLDEPTSGLDSFSAVQLCQVLKRVANAGASVLFTIHQPSSDIFASFDHLILMNKGRIMYQGAVSDVDSYFGERQHALPPKYNPADWIMIVAQSVSEEELEQQGFFEKDPREVKAAKPYLPDAEAVSRSHHVGFLTQLGMLVKRDMKSLKRDKQILGARLMLTSFSSILMGVIFWQVGESDSANFTNLNSHFGAEVMILMSAMLGTALPALIVFPSERPVFVREYSTNHYRLISYFLARLCMEAFLTGIQMVLLCTVSYFMIRFQLRYFWHLVITYALAMSSNAIAILLGSSVSDAKVAIEFLPLAFIPQLLFAGFFVATELIPAWLRWMAYIFPLTYALRLHMEKEFSSCAPGQAASNCQQLLDNVNVDTDATWWYWMVLLSLFCAFRLTAIVNLRQKANKFY